MCRVQFNDSWFVFHDSSYIWWIIWSEQNTRFWPWNLQISTKLFDKVIILKALLLLIPSIIHFFIKQKFCKYHFLWGAKINWKDKTINHSNIYFLFDLLMLESILQHSTQGNLVCPVVQKCVIVKNIIMCETKYLNK